MAKLSYILRHTQGDSSDFQRIVLRVFHCGLYCYITLDVPPVRAIDFDSYCGGAEIRMCSYYPERKRVNALLARYYTDSVYYLQTLQVDGILKNLTCKQLRDKIARQLQPVNLNYLDFAIKIVDDYEKSKRYSSARILSSVTNSVIQYASSNLTFRDID